MKKYTNWNDALKDAVAELSKDGDFSILNIADYFENEIATKRIKFSFLPPSQDIIYPEVRNAFNDMLKAGEFSNLKSYRMFYVDPTEEDPLDADLEEEEDLVNYIKEYVKNRKTPPTIKQIQSALRRKGKYTCEEIHFLIDCESTTGMKVIEKANESCSKLRVKIS